MSIKDVMETHFKNRKGFKFMPIPKSMRPTSKSIEKMGRRISSHIKNNDIMRHNSVINTSKRFVN